MQSADQYLIHLLLGEGGQANVYLGSRNSSLYALKVYLPGSTKEAAFKVQVDLLNKLKCSHLINMLDHRPQAKIKLNHKAEELRPLIVLELAQGGELFQFLSKSGPFPAEVCRVYIKQLFAAIKHLNQQGICHRDLKPQNLLFSSDFSLKISDFGLSNYSIGEKGDFKLKSRVGTEGYKPPEMEQGSYIGLQADMFAAGVILFIMYSGTPPFLSTRSHERIYKLIREKNFIKFWQMHEKNKPAGFYSSEFKRLMNSFFSYEPERRPTFESLSEDDWMNGPEMTKDDLLQFMQAKTAELNEANPHNNEIAKVREEVYKQKLMEEQTCCEGDSRADSDSQGEDGLQADQLFVKNYRKIQIRLQDLPESTKKNVSYCKQDPAFVVAWIQSYLADQFKQQQVFLDNFVGQIQPLHYTLEHLKDKTQIKLKFGFLIHEEEETELELLGNLHRSQKGGVGIDWLRSQGHTYWLTLIENRINEALKQLA